MAERKNWHRLIGLIFTPVFEHIGYRTEIEVDLSLKKQVLDIIAVKLENSDKDFSKLPKAYWEIFDDFNNHNLISFKSYSESFNPKALEEFYGHLTNYCKVNKVGRNKVNMYAIVYNYPKKILKPFENTKFLKEIKKETIFELKLDALKRIRFIITKNTENPILGLFSGNDEKILKSYSELKKQKSILDDVSSYFDKIANYYEKEFQNMYTKEDFLRDNPLTKTRTLFPWQKEYKEKMNEIKKQGKQEGELIGLQQGIEMAIMLKFGSNARSKKIIKTIYKIKNLDHIKKIKTTILNSENLSDLFSKLTE